MKHLIAAILIATSTQASARQVCNTYDVIMAGLAGDYRERLTGRGMMSNGVMIEFYVGVNGSFSVVRTEHDKRSCIVLAGKRWRKIEDNIEGMVIAPNNERIF